MDKKFTVFNDPSHGWLRVTFDDIIKVGLKVSDFTPYSYRHNENYYLEEDCDAPTFIDKWKQVFGIIHLHHKHSNGLSRIRKFNSIHS